MLYALDKIAPGVASRYTLLYGVEVKFYSARVLISNELELNMLFNLSIGIYVLGLIMLAICIVFVFQLS